MLIASRLKVMLADLGLTPESAAQALHVTSRTVRHWVSGKTLVPYAAYRLLRLQTGAELPCPGWDGWHMHSGKLWSPEGHGFEPHDSNWWGLLVSRARLFGQMYDRDRHLDLALRRMTGSAATSAGGDALASPRPAVACHPSGNAGRAAQPPGLDLSNKHIRTNNFKNEAGRSSGAIEKIAKHLAQTHHVGKQGVQS
jgi:hypothetical protein